MRRAFVLVFVALAIAGLSTGSAFATHFDGDPSTGTFNPQLSVTSSGSLTNRPSTVTFRLTQQDHEDPAAFLWLRSPGSWQYAFDALTPAGAAAGWPTGSTSQRCEAAMNGVYDSPDNTGGPTSPDTSKRHNATVARAEIIGSILLRAHVDGISRPGNPITWNGHISFLSYDAPTEVANLCLLLVTNDPRVLAVADPVPGCSGTAPRRRCDDVEAVTEIVAAFTATKKTLPDSRVVWETTGDLTDLVKDTDVVQNLHGSALELTSVLNGTSNGNWNTGGAVTFSRTPTESGSHLFEGVFQTCPQNPDASWGNCKSDKGTTTDPTVGGTVTRQVSVSVALPAPAITAPGAGALVTESNVTVSGTAEPNKSIAVFEATSLLGTTTSDSTGAWSTTVLLSEGDHTLTATQSDTGGQSPSSASRSFTVDVPPAPPILTEPADGSLHGAGQIRASGTAQPASTITVYNGAAALGTTTANAAGAWSTLVTITDKGAHALTATARDRGGEGAPSAPRAIDVTTAVPVITNPAEGSFLPSSDVVLTGTAEPGATVDLAEKGSPLASVVAVDGSFTVPLTFAEGPHTITAIATSAVDGLVSPPLTRSFEIDLTAPDAPAITFPADGSEVRALNVRFTGTSEPFATVVIEEDGAEIARGTATAAGAWTITKLLAEGPHVVRALAIDRAGNVSVPTADVSFLAIDPLKIDSPAEGATVAGTFTLRGRADTAATRLHVYVDGVQKLQRSISGGTWSAPLTLPSGEYSITVATLTSGTLSPQTPPRTVIVDASKPVVTVASTGVAGRLFLAPNQPLTGTASDDKQFDSGVVRVEVAYYDQRNQLLDSHVATCSNCPGGLVTWSSTPDLPAGVYRARITAFDAVGNSSGGTDITILKL